MKAPDDTDLRIQAVNMAITFYTGRAIGDISKMEPYLREAYIEIYNFLTNKPYSKSYEQTSNKS